MAVDLTQLDPRLQALVAQAVRDGVLKPEQITSGYRDPAHNAKVGGANGSQHIHARAFDVSGAGLDEAGKKRLVDYMVANGAKGVGIYPSGSLHFDIRDNPAFWGPNGYKGSGADTAPPWARETISKLLGSPTPSAAAPPPGAPPPSSPATAGAAPTPAAAPPGGGNFMQALQSLAGGAPVQGLAGAAPVQGLAGASPTAVPGLTGTTPTSLTALAQMLGQQQPNQGVQELWNAAAAAPKTSHLRPEANGNRDPWGRIPGLLG